MVSTSSKNLAEIVKLMADGSEFFDIFQKGLAYTKQASKADHAKSVMNGSVSPDKGCQGLDTTSAKYLVEAWQSGPLFKPFRDLGLCINSVTAAKELRHLLVDARAAGYPEIMSSDIPKLKLGRRPPCSSKEALSRLWGPNKVTVAPKRWRAMEELERQFQAKPDAAGGTLLLVPEGDDQGSEGTTHLASAELQAVYVRLSSIKADLEALKQTNDSQLVLIRQLLRAVVGDHGVDAIEASLSGQLLHSHTTPCSTPFDTGC
jgi:hypothetical protein